MTLQEYITQRPAVQDCKVVLNELEFIRHDTIKVGSYYYTSIEIPALAKHFNIQMTYVQINGRKQLYARHPKTGKVHKPSVFYLPEEDNGESLKITLYREFLDLNKDFLDNWIADNPNPPDSEEHNARFRKVYSDFLHKHKEKYMLDDDTIKFWLN